MAVLTIYRDEVEPMLESVDLSSKTRVLIKAAAELVRYAEYFEGESAALAINLTKESLGDATLFYALVMLRGEVSAKRYYAGEETMVVRYGAEIRESEMEY